MLQKVEKGTFSSVLIGDESLLVGCGDLLLERGCPIYAVVTDDPDIRQWAKGKGIAVKRMGPELATTLASQPFDWLFSIANLKLIPQQVLALAGQGAVNFHDGPLPRYAGVNAPVWALMNRETEYGVTWHLIESGIDEGRILGQRDVRIARDETAYSLNAKCYAAALESFAGVLSNLQDGSTIPMAQDLSQRTYFARDKRPEAAGRLDFGDDAETLLAMARALDHGDYWNPLCRPKFKHGGKIYLIGSAIMANQADLAKPGTILEVDATGIVVSTGTGTLRLERLTDGFGVPITPTALFAPGNILESPADSETEALTAIIAKIVKGEAGWRRHLQDLRPLSLPLVRHSGPTSDLKRKAIPLASDITYPNLIAAIAIWALRSSAEPLADIAFRTRETAMLANSAQGYLNGWVPLRVGQMPDSPTALSIAKITRQIADQLEIIDRSPAFQTDLIARDPQIGSFRTPDIGVTTGDDQMIDGTAITVAVDGQTLIITSDAIRIDPGYLDLLTDRLVGLLGTLGLNSLGETALDTLPFLPQAELDLLLTEWNRTDRDHDRTLSLHRAFEDQVAQTPDKPALIFETTALTYADLNARANKVAHVLRQMGVGTGDRVGLHTSRSPDLVIAALAILKAGAAYVPLDPAYPKDRIAHYIADSAASVIITQADLAQTLPNSAGDLLILDEDARIATAATDNPASDATADDLAYLIYTSGSTGVPKGVMVRHRNVVNFLAGMDDRIGDAKDGVWLALTSLSFDISVLELFYTLARGYKVVLSSDDDRALVSKGSGPVSDRKIDFSLFYWGNDDGAGPKKYELLLEGAKFADAHGFCAVWTPERHFHAFGGPYPNPSVTGAAVAAVTSNIGVRAGSCVAPLHHPARIAEEWAVIDNLTNGHAGLAIASGWQPDDFVLRPENTPPDNKPAMFEAIDVLRKLWRGEPVPFPTRNGEPHDVVTQPRPVSKDLPIWVTTAGNPETWKEAGAIGANVLTHLLGQSIDEVKDKIALYHQALRDAGHDPADHTVTLMLHTFVGDDRDTVRKIAREPMKDYLRSAAGLIKQYAWAFPAFKKPAGVSNPFQIDLGALADDELEAILDFAFQRYFDDSGLFGTVEDCVARVEQLKQIGVDEVACLIDYGIATDKVMHGLTALADVLQRANADTILDGDDFSIAAQIRRHAVTHLQCTPSMARMLTLNDAARVALGQVGTLMVGGEALPAALARDLRAATPARILNMYGPTETTIWSTTAEIAGGDSAVPIGRPIANTQVYVLDAGGNPVPVGVPGELFIAGDGVTAGYWQRDDLTAERFPEDPFAVPGGSGTPDRMYRTGDLAQWRADGQLEFLGRTDHQVKLRGHRIELGEIEAALVALPGVNAAVVVAREHADGDHRLVAYVTGDGQVSTADLSQSLADRLPRHMVPAQIVAIDAFPLTPNRKIDRKALAETEPARPKPEKSAVAAPASSTERTIAVVWSRVLGIGDIAPDDNFFALGGHSLLAVQVHRELSRSLDSVPLSITDIFAYPTLGKLADHIDAKAERHTKTTAPSTEKPATATPDRAAMMSGRRAMRARREMEDG